MTENSFDTKVVRLGFSPEQSNCYSLVPPIGLATAFEQDDPATHKGYLYSRLSNPSRSQLEKGIALLEDSKYALCYSSGTSAISAIVQLLRSGDHIVSDSIIFGGTYRYFDKVSPRADITTTFVDATKPENVEEALQKHPNTKLVFLESPGNPLTTVCNIARIAEIVREHEGVILAVDNTFLTPFFQKPLKLGAHVTAYSLTKYMNGHGDVCMGAVCCNDEDIYSRLKYLQIIAGLNPSPFDCYLAFRGLKTLSVRMRQHMKNGIEVAKFLENHPKVVKVLHPWLPSHPQHELAKKQATGHCGMIAFYVTGGLKETSKILKSFKLVYMAGSFGGVHSFAAVPSVLVHACVPEDVRQRLGITDNLIRLSVGIEDSKDIIADLDQALNLIVWLQSIFGDMSEHSFDTKVVTLGYNPEQCNCYSVVPPIGLSTTFQQEDPATHKGYLYTRQSNPSRTQLEKGIALLEDSKYALCYSSGTSAISAIVQLLSSGDHIVSDSIIFGGTYRYFDKISARANVTTTYVDATDPENVEKALQQHPNTKLVFLESPSNPLTTVCDIARIAEIVREHEGVILAVDNTFLTSFFQKPLKLGAHVTAYSLTKYMNGHDDVCMGAVCCNDEQTYLRLKYLQNNAGLNPSPFDCYLAFRGLKTLSVRMRQHMKNGIEVAKFLENHPKVIKVLHPWLPSHPQHQVAKKQATGHSGMIAFYVPGGFKETSQILKSFKLVDMAGSLGGVRSIAEVPAVLSHASIPEDVRQRLGITDNLIRLSVGIEDAKDIIADLDQALNVIGK